jgi:serine/threonine protein kinase
MSGYPPFTGKYDNEILHKISHGKFSLRAVEWKHISSEGKRFLTKMIRLDSSKRYSAEKCLKNSWF